MWLSVLGPLYVSGEDGELVKGHYAVRADKQGSEDRALFGRGDDHFAVLPAHIKRAKHR